MSHVTEVGVSTTDINRLFEALSPILQVESQQLVQAALITLLLQNIGPDDITDEELAKGVHDVSTLLILYCQRLRLQKSLEDLKLLATPMRVES